MSHVRILCFSFIILLLLTYQCCKAKHYSKSREKTLRHQWELRETNQFNFIRLVIMRMVYGFAVQLGLEERLIKFFSGAFAPPNADYDDDYDLDIF